MQEALHNVAAHSATQVSTIFQAISTKEMPPTYFITNKYTEAFQSIVDAYGYVPVYHCN